MTYLPISPTTLLRCVLVLFATALSPYLHAQFTDNFSDGDFANNPTWEGNTDHFIVNASQQLQLNASGTGQSILYTSFASTSLDNREWQLWVRQNFAGSDNNQSRIYLAANGVPGNYTGTGTAGVQGYFLKLGEAGSADAIKLCRDNGSGPVVEIAAGTPALVASSFILRIKVTRNASGLWNVFAAPSGGENYQLEATTTDAIYTTTSHFGIICTYTSGNVSNFYFDDISFGDVVLDTTPPTLVSASATTSTTVNAVFSESLDIPSATNAANYSVVGIGTATSAQMNGATQVALTFATSFPSGVQQTLQVTGVEDLSGNVMLPGSTTFTWFDAAPGSYRQVVINELLADPTPPVGLPDAEFVELFNSSQDVFNLQGWKFVNTTTVRELPNYLLLPGEYVILCDNNNAPLFSPNPVIGITSFVALANAADSLTLLNANNELIDWVSYSSTWFETPGKSTGGWTLEQINPFLPCPGRHNWKESVHPSGGTPAVANSVLNADPDTAPPVLVRAEVVTPGTIVLYFNETMDTESIQTATFEMFPDFVFSGFTWNGFATSLAFTISPILEPGIPFELVFFGLADCSGNSMGITEVEILLGETPDPGDVIINEIMANPAPVIGGPADEYIELYNRSNKVIDMRGSRLNGDPFQNQTLLLPGGFLIVADDGSVLSFTDYPQAVFLNSFPGLTNSGRELILTNPSGEELDRVFYRDTWYKESSKTSGGWALELINPDAPCSDENNWTASVDPRGMTAGEQNSVYNTTPDTSAPVFQLALNEPFASISLLFNKPMEPASIANLVWTINGEIQSNAGVIASPLNPRIVIFPLPELGSGTIHQIGVSGLSDCWGNSVVPFTSPFGIPQAAEPGDIIINEILFNPNTPGQDFVEVYNRSPRAVSLQGWSLARETNGVPASFVEITSQVLTLLPGEYLVLTRSGHFLETHYPFTRRNRVWLMPSLPAYNNGDGTCYLVMNNGEMSDVFSYTESMHFPLLDNVKGVSLERIDFNRPSSDLTNWASASHTQGYATPGYLNSQAFSAGISEEQVTVEPEIFSPDNDGYQDVLTISYTTDRAGLAGSITIFNSDGIRVRRLMQNELLGREGQISWNGFGDKGETLAMGVYIIYFEAFDTAGKVSRIKKTCVLARQLSSN